MCPVSSIVGVFYVIHTLCTYGVDRGLNFNTVSSSTTSTVELDTLGSSSHILNSEEDILEALIFPE
jgi:hypothetical protein